MRCKSDVVMRHCCLPRPDGRVGADCAALPPDAALLQCSAALLRVLLCLRAPECLCAA